MVFFNLFNRKKARFHAPKGAQKTTTRGRVGLKVERLEDRLTPSGVTPSVVKLTTTTQALIASSFFDSAVYEFDGGTGALLKTLVAPNSQSTLSGPSGMTVGPDGNLYFASENNSSIVEYNFSTGSLSTFISSTQLAAAAAASDPSGLAFGPDGNLYVSLNGGQQAFSGGTVVRFSITSSGSQLSYNGTSTTVATGFTQPTEMVFGADNGDTNNLYVSDAGDGLPGTGTVDKITDAVGVSPTMSVFIAAETGGLIYPTGLNWGTNGLLYVTDLGNSLGGSSVGQVLEFNTNGTFNQVFTQGNNLLYQFPSDAQFLANGTLVTADLGGSYPINFPGVGTEEGGVGTSGAIDQFNANGTFDQVFSSSTFPNNPTTGVTNFSPSQLALGTFAPSGSTVPLAQGTVKVAYNQTITATGNGSTTLTVSNIQNAIAGLTIPSSGTNTLHITGLPTSAGTETFTVTATDSASDTSTVTYFVTVNPAPNPAITLSPAPLRGDTVNTAYDQTITASGGTGTVMLAVTNIQHAIPGLTIPSSGPGFLNITGTPTATGTETFTVTATDTLGATATTAYSITVDGAAITLSNIPADTVGVAYNQSITASGGTGTITLTVSNIQNPIPGLTIPASGTGSLHITGTPTAAGTETFTVTATDSAGDTTTATYSTATTINFASGSAVHLVGGADDEYTSYTQSGFVVTPDIAVDGPGAHFHMDSTGLYTHVHDDELGGPGVTLLQRSDGGAYILTSLEVPQLTNGGSLTFADSAGDSMTVTATGNYTFNWGPITWLSVTPNNLLDSASSRGYVNDIVVSSLSNYALTIDPAVTFTPSPLPAGTVNTAYAQTIAVYGGTGLINLAVSNVQNAIAGLVVQASGTGNLSVSGTPTAKGTETFKVTGTDALGQISTTTYSITVDPSATPITLSNIPGDTVGVPYNQSITASGGTGTITLTVTNIQNAIPGLNVPANGTGSLNITGTPTAAGTETFTVTATDSAGDTTTATYSTATTINFDSGSAVHLVGGDPDEYTSYTQGGFVVTPDVAVDGAGAHFHMNSTGLYTHIHDDEPGGPGVVMLQRTDSGPFILDTLVVPQLSSGGSLTFADSVGDTMTVTTTGTYTFDWGPITSFTITPNNLLDSLGQMGYVDDIVVNSLSNFALTAAPAITLSSSPLPNATINTAYNQTIAVNGGTGLINLAVSNVQNAIPGLTVPSSATGALVITGTPTASGTETFKVTATDAVGAQTTTTYSVTVNVYEIEVYLPTQPTPPSPAGLSANTLYVAGLYRDLLGRQGAPSELQIWVNQLQAGATRTQVAQGIMHSTEYLSTEVEGYYETFLGRAGDSGGVAGWVSDLQAGATEQQVILGFLTSTEFINAHNNSTAYVGALYNLVLGRNGSTGDINGWTTLIANKTMTEAQVAQFFLNCNEAETDVVNAFYESMLAQSCRPRRAGGVAQRPADGRHFG